MNEFKNNLDKWFRVKFGILGGKEMFEETIGVDYNYDSYDGKLTEFFELDVKEDEIWEKYFKNEYRFYSIIDKLPGLIKLFIPWKFREHMKSIQEALDITVEQIKILGIIKENINYQSNIISKLHGKVRELIGSYKKSLSHQIADRLQELNHLEKEKINLLCEKNYYSHSIVKNYLLLGKREIPNEIFDKELKNLGKKMSESVSLIEEVTKTINSYKGDISGLIEKYTKIMT